MTQLANARPSFWTSMLVMACLALSVLLWATRGWQHLGVMPINAERTPFSDTIVHLGTAVNCANGLGQWHGRVCFVPGIDAVPRAQTYEPWLSLHRLGIDSENEAQAIAWGMLLGFCLAFALLLKPRTAGQALLALALFATAAVQLAVERGNFDLLLFTLLCLAAALLAQPRPLPGLAGVAVLAFATMLKLYTGLACLLAWTAGRAPLRWLLPASLAGLAVVILVVGPRELLVLAGGAPEGATRFSTGARWLFLQAGSTWAAAAIAVALAAIAVTQLHLRNAALPDLDRWPRRRAAFLVGFLTAVPLFLLKDSYDYRMVLWLPCLALPFAWLTPAAVDPRWRRFGIALIALFATVTAMELPCTWVDALAEGGVEGARSIAWALSLVKQFAAWTLAGLLTLLAARILVQEWRPRRAGTGTSPT